LKGSSITASVADHLVRLAKEHRRDHAFILVRYGIERLLWRLSQTPFSTEFVVKGGTLLLLWYGNQTRPKRDLDLLGRGTPDPGRLATLFRSLCAIDAAVVDGLVFDPESVVASRIKEDQEYEGVRLRMRASLGRTRIDIQVDVGFGDEITPPPIKAIFPTLLGQPAPEVLVYPSATVIAEKLHAIVDLGFRSTRMKDYFDLTLLLESNVVPEPLLAEAIRSTFARRRTPLPSDVPAGLSEEFGSDAEKQKQWRAFQSRLQLDDERPLEEIVAILRSRVLHLLILP
jgi:predicted nucleotidyltransferase component of viral defense system